MGSYQGGFIFDGVDISSLGLEYVPENGDTYVWNPAQAAMHEQKFDGHDGGYYYGFTYQPKDFNLRCVFENHKIKDGFMAMLYHVFKPGKTGRLVFSRRPWVYYMATVITPPSITMLLNPSNGLLTITMRVYYPFGRTDKMYIEATDPDSKDVYLNSAMMTGSAWNLPTSFGSPTISTQKSFELFNPGDARADVAVEIAGDFGTGVIIENHTNGQQMKFIGATRANTTNMSRYILCDGLNGKCLLTNDSGTVRELGFLYHDYGFIQLEPAFPCARNVYVNGSSGSTEISVSNYIISQDWVGQYICKQSGGNRYKISAVNPSTNKITLAKALTENMKGMAVIIKMNELSIYPVTTMSITRLKFVYKPTFY